jgi:hypothetical protein
LQHPVYEPHRDEFLYMAEGRRLAWGYPEGPPLLSLLTYISNGPGDGLFWIKCWPALFGALTYVLVARMILLLGGGRFALLLGFLPFVCGYLLHIHFMLQPRFLEVFFSTAMVYGLVRHIRTRRPGGLYLAGVAFGLGMLSQYSLLVFAGGIFFGLLLTPERQLLGNRHFYFALLLGVSIFLPNLLWQVRHGWELPQPAHLNRLQFLQDQLVLNLPGLFTWGAGLYWLLRIPEGKPYRFAGWAALLVLGFLALTRGKSNAAMEAYPVLFGFGALWLERVTAVRRRAWRYALVGFALATGCWLDAIAVPVLPPQELANYYSRHPLFRQLGLLRWDDGRDHALPQDFADMLGWEEMACKAARVYDGLDSLDKTMVIVGSDHSYGESGALDFYAPKYSLPAPTRDYDVLILTTDHRDRPCGQYRKKWAYAAIVDSVTHPYSREFGTYILLMKGRRVYLGAR